MIDDVRVFEEVDSLLLEPLAGLYFTGPSVYSYSLTKPNTVYIIVLTPRFLRTFSLFSANISFLSIYFILNTQPFRRSFLFLSSSIHPTNQT